jgi:hypothetical protein
MLSHRRSQRSEHRRFFKPALEVLEDRRLLATGTSIAFPQLTADLQQIQADFGRMGQDIAKGNLAGWVKDANAAFNDSKKFVSDINVNSIANSFVNNLPPAQKMAGNTLLAIQGGFNAVGAALTGSKQALDKEIKAIDQAFQIYFNALNKAIQNILSAQFDRNFSFAPSNQARDPDNDQDVDMY